LKILFVEPRVPTPNRDGGSFRKTHLLRMLLDMGADVSFLPEFADAWPPFDRSSTEDRRSLKDMNVTLVTQSLREHLIANSTRYDVIVLATAPIAAKYISWVRENALNAELVFDTVDLHYVRAYREAKVNRNLHALQNSMQLKRMELAAVKCADHVWVVSETEKSTLEREVPSARLSVIPNVHETADNVPGFSQRDGIFFLGSYTFSPNVHAVKAFVKDVFPILQKKNPDLHFHIVGADPTPEILELANNRIHVTGFVENLIDFLNLRRVCIAPLAFGAGIKGKILLSMGMGIPVVTNDIGAEGIPGRSGVHWITANAAETWAEEIQRTYTDQTRWESLSEKGRELVQRHYSSATVSEALRNALVFKKGTSSYA